MKSNKPRKRATYSREFKLEAVRMVRARRKSVTQIAAELGVDRQQLHSWVRLADGPEGQNKDEVFRGNGKRTSADAEIARLRRELAQAKEDNEILKKATAFFAKESR